MWWQITRRFTVLVASVVAASVVVFGLLTLVGDPVRSVLGLHASEGAITELRHRMGLDRPIAVQYLSWAGGIIRGDYGTSYVTHFPIGPEIGSRLGVTIHLVLGGMVVAVALAVPAGTFAALRADRPSGHLVSALSQIGVAVPAFLAGILLIAVFAVGLGLLPSGGYTAPTEGFGSFLAGMVLPWLSLGLVQGAVLARYLRSSLLDEMGKDYLRTARAKGRSRTGAVLRHGLRNATIPVLTVVGIQLVTVLVGAVVVERVFVIPGLGSFLIDSVGRQDRLAVQGIVITIVVLSLLVSFIIDVLYTMLDPRLRRRG